MNKQLDFKLRYSGDIVAGKSISIRTLGNTLPHFQRAIDKSVIFVESGEVIRNKGIARASYSDADLMLELLEEGSVVLPLWGAIKEESVKFFKWAITEPYNKAVHGEVGFNRDSQIETYKVRQKEKDIEEKSQKDLILDANKNKRKYARSAVLADVNNMFNVVRAPGERQIDLNVTKPGEEASYVFNKQIAKDFRKIVATPYPTEPVVYKGKYNGYKQLGRKDGGFEVYVKSDYSDQVVNVFVKKVEELNLFARLKNNDEVIFWASPIQKYGAFDVYSGSVIFIGMYS